MFFGVARDLAQRVAGKRIRDASGLSFLCQDRTFFVKTNVQFTENQRNSLTGCYKPFYRDLRQSSNVINCLLIGLKYFI